MEFQIKEQRLEKVLEIEPEIRVPDGVVSIAPSAFWDRERKTTHIILPASVKEFQEDKYDSSLSVHKGTIITLPASVYEQITENVAGNYDAYAPYRDSEIRFDILMDDGTQVELFFIHDCDDGDSLDDKMTFWEIENFAEFDFEDYDDYIEEELPDRIFKVSQKVRLVLSRLYRPYQLSDDRKEVFEKYICSHIADTIKYILEYDYDDLLCFLMESGIINNKNQKKAKDLIVVSNAPKCRDLWEKSNL